MPLCVSHSAAITRIKPFMMMKLRIRRRPHVRRFRSDPHAWRLHPAAEELSSPIRRGEFDRTRFISEERVA